MGMKGATSNNSCIWCKIHKSERYNKYPCHWKITILFPWGICIWNLLMCIWCNLLVSRCNMSHSCAHFPIPELARAVDDTWPNQPGCHSPLLFSIAVENVVLDELHLMSRITDRKEEGLIHDILEWDQVNNIKMPSIQLFVCVGACKTL